MNCCNNDCRQGRDCPLQSTLDITDAVLIVIGSLLLGFVVTAPLWFLP